MTTFHDPQPQSRRAVRQSERADENENQAAFTEGQDSPPQQYSAPAADMWDTVSRRAAALPPVSTRQEPVAGRRAATPPVAQPEPLIYSTQSRPAMPSYEGPTFRSRGASAPQPVPLDREALESGDTTDTSPGSRDAQGDQTSFRVRDFSPEARGGATASESRWGAPAPTVPVAPSDLDYHTEARFRAAAAAAPLAPVSEVPAAVAPINKLWAAPAPAAEPEPQFVPRSSAEYPFEQTMTRRELRAMQQAEEAAALQSQQPEPRPAAPAPVAEEPILTTAQPEAITPPPLSTQQPVSTEQPVGTEQPHVFPLIEPQAVTPVPPVAAPVSASPFDSLFTPAAAAPAEPVAELPAALAPAPPVEEPTPWTPPTGHWSTQLDDEDDVETTINRRIGSGTTTTSALVLPEIPNGTDIRGPLTSTGEIMLTGSIDLPRNFAATGQSDRYDSGLDELFDLNDAEITSTDSSPVRAIRAVSTHTSGHGVTHTQKPKGTRALTALLIAASSMAVVVAGLLVAAFAFNVF